MNPATARRWTAAALGLLALAPLLALHGYVGREHDDALYVIAAHSLARGEYRHWHLPGRPPITAVTPGLPALLLPAAWAAPERLPAYQILSALYLSLATLLVFLWLRRRARVPEALALTALFALNPLALSRAGSVMPEAPALALGLAALLCWEKEMAWRAGLLAAAACLVRPAALPFPAALALAAFARKDARAAMKAVLPALAAFLLWRLWCAQGGGLSESAELRENYAAGVLHVLGRTARVNAGSLARSWGSTFLPAGASETASKITGAALLALTAAGLWKERARLDAGDLVLAGNAAMHLAWPWWYDRYLLTFIPFLLRRAADAAPAGRAKAWSLAGLAALQFAVHGRLWVAPGVALERPPHAEAYAWIDAHTAPSDVLASPFYARDALYTGRIFLPLSYARLGETPARFVLWEDVSDLGFSLEDGPAARALKGDKALLDDPALFRPVFAGGGVLLYEKVTPRPTAPGKTPSP